MSVHQPEVRLLICVTFHSCQGTVYGTEDSSKSDIIRWEQEYMMVESLVMKKVHGIIHRSGKVKGRREDMVGAGFEGI